MDISAKFSIIISVLYCFHITKIHGKTDVLGTLNGNVTLICPIRHSSSDGKTLIWAGPPYTGESGSTYFTTDDGVNTDTALGSRLSIVGNNTAGEYNMMISILQESDEGKYRCVYGTNNFEYFLRLKVMLSAVTLKPNYLQIKEGSTCDFLCRTSDSAPAANITWYKVRQGSLAPIKLTGDISISYEGKATISTLTYTGQKQDNNGSVYCNASQESTHIKSQTLHISVLYKPEVLDILSPSIVEGKNLHLTCLSRANPPAKIYKWEKIGNDTFQQNNKTLVIPNIRRTQSGKYKCTAKNIMAPTNGATENGEGNNEVVVNVKYPPTIKTLGLIGYEMEISEDDEISLACVIDSYPKSNVTWTSNTGNDRLKHVEYMTTISFYNITTTCLDTGTYTCTALNGIGNSALNETILFVRCSPRIDNRLQQTMHNKIAIKTGQRLNISARYLAYPIAKVTWVFSPQNSTDNRNRTLNDSDIDVNICNKNYIYWQTSEMTKSAMTEDDFGIYTVIFKNELSSASSEFYVEPEQAPDAPSSFMPKCLDDSTVNITWSTGFSGGSEQHFIIQYRKSDEYLFRNWTKEIPDANTNISEILDGLQYGIKYYFRVVAVNSKGETPSNEEYCIIVVQPVIEQSSVMHLVGTSLGSLAVLSAIIVVLLYFGRKKQLKAKKRNNEFLMNRKLTQRYSIDDEDGMKDNILYEPAGPNYKPKGATGGKNDIYAEVRNPNRRSQNACDIYAEVKKAKKKDFRKEKDQAFGTEVYDNVEELNKGNLASGILADTLPGPSGECFSEKSSKLPKRNKDGLLYADLVLQEGKTDGNKFVIRGIEDRTVYIEVDFSKRAFPLPADDDKN